MILDIEDRITKPATCSNCVYFFSNLGDGPSIVRGSCEVDWLPDNEITHPVAADHWCRRWWGEELGNDHSENPR